MTNRHDFRLDEKLGLDRVESAAYMGVGATTFDKMVDDGTAPQPKAAYGRILWDREELRLAFKALPRKMRAAKVPEGDAPPAEGNPWDRNRNKVA